jgi:hypothetical protein
VALGGMQVVSLIPGGQGFLDSVGISQVGNGIQDAGASLDKAIGAGGVITDIADGIGSMFGGSHHRKTYHRVPSMTLNRQQIDDITKALQHRLDAARDLKQEKTARLNDFENKSQGYVSGWTSLLKLLQSTASAIGANLK